MKVRDVVRRLEDNGWMLVRRKGSHRQFKHSVNPNVITVAGKESEGKSAMKYPVVFERTRTGYSAYAPDLPGLGVAGETIDEVRRLLSGAIVFHIEGLRQAGLAVPEPSQMEMVEA